MNDRQIELETSRMIDRRAKLRALLKLTREVDALERRYLVTNCELAKSIRRIAEIVSSHFKVPVTVIEQKSRQEKFIVPRHVIIYLVRKLTASTSVAIGDALNLNHGTVLYACERVDERRETDSRFAMDLSVLEDQCQRCEQDAKKN